jgi:hypothetical protein
MRFRLILLGTLASAMVLGANAPEYVLVANYYSDLKEVDLRTLNVRSSDLGSELPPTFLGFEADLNGDSAPEHVLRGPADRCGTGGCSLWIIDGKTKVHIASMFGRPLSVHSAKINGWPVLSIYAHLGATDGTFTTYVFDGKRYQQVSSLMLYDQAVSDLFKKLESVPSIGNPPSVVHTAPNKSLQRSARP